MESVSKKSDGRAEEVVFSFREYVDACLRRWPWFAVSVVVFVGLAILYVKRQEPLYERSEQVLVKDGESGGAMGAISGAFSSFGMGSGNAGVYNEMIAMTSPAVMYEVVRRLDLDMSYNRKGKMHPVTLYGESLPVKVKMADVEEQKSASFDMRLNPDGEIVLRKFTRSTEEGTEKLDGEVVMKKGQQEVSTPVGKVIVTPNPDYIGKKEEQVVDIEVSKVPMQKAVENYGRQLNGELADREADVIDLSIRDTSVQRAEDILNMIIVVYNEEWIKDKNKLALATSRFIDERLKVIQAELGDVDLSIARYQESTGTTNLSATANLSLHKEAELEDRIVGYGNQLSMSESMLEHISKPENRYNVVPLNIGLGSEGIETQVAQYNDLLLTRNNILENSSEQNPIVEDLDSRLGGMRQSLLSSISSHIKNLRSLIKSAVSERSKAEGKMLSTPSKVLPLLSEERQQKVKESLYIFLLQKREETEIGQQFTADNIRVITPPMGSLKPVSPRKMLILLFALIMSVLIPLACVYMFIICDTKVHGKKDLERVRIPFAGEIPQVGKRGRLRTNANKKRGSLKDEKAPMAVVEEGKRDVVNEAFRVIRSNIDFMAGRNQGSHVIMFTSFNPGSGKSFISYNLALSFALKQKRVLLIDCDLRHGSSSMYVGMPKKGITDYLSGHTDAWQQLLSASPANSNLSIMPIGKIPPNPAELLEGERLRSLIEDARKEYDYVFLDCPPVNIVVDTQIVAPYADATMFVVRAGLLEKSAIPELNELYDEKRFRNIALILNGTDTAHSRYYTYGNYQSFAD